MYINQLLHILNSFIKTMQGDAIKSIKLIMTYFYPVSSTGVMCGQKVGGARSVMGGVEETQLLKLNDFLFTSHLDNVNFFKVLRYCQRSQISKKVKRSTVLMYSVILSVVQHYIAISLFVVKWICRSLF